MLFRQLEYFVALARERHFARAASSCYVSQPALSEAIRKLEKELKVPLVLRGSSFEGLTPEGERLVPWARRILADRDALEHEVTALRTGLTGELTIGVIPAAATSAAVLADPFCTAHPLVRVRLWAGLRSAEIVERLHRFELDAGIVYSDGVDVAGLTVTPLYPDRLALVARADLLREGDEPLAWNDAAQLPMCLLHKGMHGRDLIDAAAEAHNVRLSPRLESDSVATLLAMVGAGRWATIVPRAWIATYRAPSGTRVIDLEVSSGRPVLTSPVALVRHAGEPESVLARAFAESARQA
ncbi:LysR family transcriptional regulator [Tsukamurella sp. PLM1]|uniref:LysR family transcriptional regulator n=1 Tax=Tsukamurella sp. PLM1 TaxID=2929795 RepID=UPI00205E4EC7|nr:LysR family transcriptional regulator [Tsukamurella sp. PLM1]BDH56060.1 transcriptional regulator, LysR family protein [Tsukamurella sp. PLM1]